MFAEPKFNPKNIRDQQRQTDVTGKAFGILRSLNHHILRDVRNNTSELRLEKRQEKKDTSPISRTGENHLQSSILARRDWRQWREVQWDPAWRSIRNFKCTYGDWKRTYPHITLQPLKTNNRRWLVQWRTIEITEESTNIINFCPLSLDVQIDGQTMDLIRWKSSEPRRRAMKSLDRSSFVLDASDRMIEWDSVNE